MPRSGDLSQCGLAEVYLRTKWHLDSSSRLATTDMGRKLGAVSLFLGVVAGSHAAQCGRGRGLPPCQVSSPAIQPFAHNTPTSVTDRTGQTRQTGQTIVR